MHSNKPTYQANEIDPGLFNQLEQFKQAARRAAQSTLPPNQSKLFLASKAPRNRLAQSGIANKQPAIKAKPHISSEGAKAIQLAILKQIGIKKQAQWQALEQNELRIGALLQGS